MDNKKAGLDVAYNKKRIFDQMASMHFRLSDEYKRLASIEDAIEIIISVALCGITFLDTGCRKAPGKCKNSPCFVLSKRKQKRYNNRKSRKRNHRQK